eukprot:IDg18994t1
MNYSSDEDEPIFVAAIPEKRSASPDYPNPRPVKRQHEVPASEPAPSDALADAPSDTPVNSPSDGVADAPSNAGSSSAAASGSSASSSTTEAARTHAEIPNPPAASNGAQLLEEPAPFPCSICLDDHPAHDALALGACAHKFCRACMTQYLTVVANETRRIPIKCPECSDALEPQLCVAVLEGTPARDALERLIVERSLSDVRYCANPTCATPFDYDGAGADNARVDCPLCGTATCADCSAPWHRWCTLRTCSRG